MVKGMRIGIGATAGSLAGAIDEVKRAEQAGFATAWFSNIFAYDALTLVALAGRETERIELGTAVVPTHSRHPYYMAQQALTTQAATSGRLALGLGPSHKIVIENMLGLSFDRPALHVREYLEVVRALVHEGKVAFQGKLYRVQAQSQVPEARPFPILIGGLGERMRRIAATLADGTITWMAGKRALRDVLIPDLHGAAVSAGRPAPRIVAALPIALSEDESAARDAVSRALAVYPQLPSYRAMLDIEKAERAGDIALCGSEEKVERELEELAEAGVTDLMASIVAVGPDPKAAARRSFEFLAGLARRGP
jgi:F420-dependent oxidoreductase-like protein